MLDKWAHAFAVHVLTMRIALVKINRKRDGASYKCGVRTQKRSLKD